MRVVVVVKGGVAPGKSFHTLTNVRDCRSRTSGFSGGDR